MSGTLSAFTQENERSTEEAAKTSSIDSGSDSSRPARHRTSETARDMLELAQFILIKDPKKKKKRPLDPSMFAVVVHVQRLGGASQL